MEGKLFGLPMWAALLALGGAGILGYMIFFRNRAAPSGGGTTGYSPQALAVMQNPDESATMALQNQELSQLGVQTEQDYVATRQAIDQSHQNIIDLLYTVSGGLSQQLGDSTTSLKENENGINQQLNQMLGSMLASLSGQQQQTNQQQQAYFQSLLTNFQSYVNSVNTATKNPTVVGGALQPVVIGQPTVHPVTAA